MNTTNNPAPETLTFEDTRNLRRLMRYADRITCAEENNRTAAIHLDLDADGEHPRDLEITACDGQRRLLKAAVTADRGSIAGRHHYSMPNGLAKAIAKTPDGPLRIEIQRQSIIIRPQSADDPASSFYDIDKVPKDTYRNAVARFRDETRNPIWTHTLDYREATNATRKLRAIRRSDPRPDGHVTVFGLDEVMEFDGATRSRARNAHTDPEIELVDLVQALGDINRGESAETMLCETGYRLRVSIVGRRHETYLRTVHRH